jgi:UDP-3-O-[3-hydroxymyristoyl] glucosamine N-acyltransferase
MKENKMTYNVKNKHISGNARVYDNAKVSDNAWVSDNVWVSDNAGVYGNAWVSDNARVYGNARVYDNAWVSDNARVYGNAKVFGNARVSGDGKIEKTSDYLILGPAKSSERFTTAHIDSKIGVRVNCGCFSGTVKEFSDAIEKTHKNNPEYLKQYRLFCQLIAFNFNVKE